MAIFGPKPWVNPFGKMSIFVQKPKKKKKKKKNANFSTIRTFCFYSLERRFFVLEDRRRYFAGLMILPKKKSRKNGHFWTKTMR